LSGYQLPCPLGFLYWSPIDDRAGIVNALFINIDFARERIIPIARAPARSLRARGAACKWTGVERGREQTSLGRMQQQRESGTREREREKMRAILLDIER